jgi:uncharacterized membrane protein
MVARFEPAIREQGAWMYSRLFWETGVIGQILYLEAHAFGISATGIGCYFDDAGLFLSLSSCSNFISTSGVQCAHYLSLSMIQLDVRLVEDLLVVLMLKSYFVIVFLQCMTYWGWRAVSFKASTTLQLGFLLLTSVF